jgi:hypothetical protein
MYCGVTSMLAVAVNMFEADTLNLRAGRPRLQVFEGLSKSDFEHVGHPASHHKRSPRANGVWPRKRRLDPTTGVQPESLSPSLFSERFTKGRICLEVADTYRRAMDDSRHRGFVEYA